MPFDASAFRDALTLTVITYGWLLPIAGAAVYCGFVLHTLGRGK